MRAALVRACSLDLKLRIRVRDDCLAASDGDASVVLVRRVTALLALLCLLGVAGPALAHTDLRERAVPAVSASAPLAPSPPAKPEASATAPRAVETPERATGTILLIAVLALLALIVAGRTLSHRLRGPAAGATTVVLLVFIAESGPHLVHHALNPAQGEECQVLKATSHSEAVAFSDALLHISSAVQSLAPAAELRPLAVAVPAARGRGPPAG
ncbi:MAG TPA: hypothetical protein VLU43_18410 [Anaeromyxobacteraceae bacterium]|nr:hypothetical protein [Anaeromyxobacteraceae bacterium]